MLQSFIHFLLSSFKQLTLVVCALEKTGMVSSKNNLMILLIIYSLDDFK
jgi:hypothetical protein